VNGRVVEWTELPRVLLAPRTPDFAGVFAAAAFAFAFAACGVLSVCVAPRTPTTGAVEAGVEVEVAAGVVVCAGAGVVVVVGAGVTLIVAGAGVAWTTGV